MKYPKAIIVKGSSNEVEPVVIRESDIQKPPVFAMVPHGGLEAFIAVRSIGNFKDKSIYLSTAFEWQIVEDSHGMTVLIALKKK